ncbi:MAG: type IV pilus modification protein PilV [Rudaea sp.]|uniref:type IV pilus modification protein PilV n=1 Tax=Rudaea sp. TaxID=2136325 RepID=UPI0039E554C0
MPARAPRGFTLMEVLITLIVLSIGLLGLAALQITAVRTNQSANLRTQAISLANLIVDRMRANSGYARQGAYYLDGTYTAPTCTAGSPLLDSDSAFTPTSATDVAPKDLALWEYKIACQLPDGIGKITYPGGNVTIDITWTDSRWAATAADRSTTFTLVTTL